MPYDKYSGKFKNLPFRGKDEFSALGLDGGVTPVGYRNSAKLIGLESVYPYRSILSAIELIGRKMLWATESLDFFRNADPKDRIGIYQALIDFARHGISVFDGNATAFHAWMTTPKSNFDGKKPFFFLFDGADYAGDSASKIEVLKARIEGIDAALTRIEHGVF